MFDYKARIEQLCFSQLMQLGGQVTSRLTGFTMVYLRIKALEPLFSIMVYNCNIHRDRSDLSSPA